MRLLLALWRKELRQLLPVTVVWLITSVLGIVTQLLSNRPDEVSFSEYCELYCGPGFSPEYAIITVIFALTFAYSLFPREHDEATINFLRPLPLSRTTVFYVKVLAALSAIVMISGITLAIEAAMLSFNRQSLDGGLYLGVSLMLIFRDVIFAAIVLCHGMLLSWFRLTGLLIYAAYFILLALADRFTNTLAGLNVLRITETDYVGKALVLNWSLIIPHGIAAIVILILASWLWTRRDSTGDGAATTGISQRRQWAARITAIVAFGFASVLLIGSQAGRGLQGNEELTTTATQHYRFVYQNNRQALAERLLKTADSDYQILRQRFGFEQSPFVQVDATAQRSEVAGLAQWKKVIMELSYDHSPTFTRHILNHEATHVFQSVTANGHLRHYFPSVRFFIEGMAEFAAYSVNDTEHSRREKDHFLASVAAERYDIDFATLANDSLFSARYDPELHYTLGDLWVESLTAVCGEQASTQVLEVFADESLSRQLTGVSLWESVLQQMNCSLQDINADWQTRQSALITDFSATVIPTLDQMQFEHQPDNGVVVFSATVAQHPLTNTLAHSSKATSAPNNESDQLIEQQSEGSVTPTWLLRIKPEGSFQPGATLQFRGRTESREDGDIITFRVPDHHFPSNRFSYQPGVDVFATARTFWQPWKQGTLRLN